ncbi:MAG: radical SAM protein [Candidatus Wallbacteria bacterium]
MKNNHNNYFKIYYYKFLKNYYLIFTEIPSVVAIDEEFYNFLKINKIKNAVDILTHELSSEEYRSNISNFIEEFKKSDYLKNEEKFQDYCDNFEKHFDVKGIWLGLTHNCNMDCEYCFEKSGARKTPSDMTIDTAKKAIDFLVKNSKNKNISVILFGGEPLLKFDLIKEIVKYCEKKEKEVEKKFLLSFTTNAILLDKEKFDYFKSKNIGILISFDGNDSMNCYRKLKNGDKSFPIIMKNLKEINTANMAFRATLTDKNLDIPKVSNFFKDELSSSNYFLSECSYNSFLDNSSVKKLKKIYIDMIEHRKFAELPQNFKIMIQNVKNGVKRNFGCLTGINYFYFTPDENIYPCARVINQEQEIKFGNLKYELHIKNVKDFFNLMLVKNSNCKKCWAKYFCGGGCYGEKIEINNSYVKPVKQFCQLNRFKLKLIMSTIEKW